MGAFVYLQWGPTPSIIIACKYGRPSWSTNHWRFVSFEFFLHSSYGQFYVSAQTSIRLRVFQTLSGILEMQQRGRLANVRGHVFNNNYPWQNCIPMLRSLWLTETLLSAWWSIVQQVQRALQTSRYPSAENFWIFPSDDGRSLEVMLYTRCTRFA